MHKIVMLNKIMVALLLLASVSLAGTVHGIVYDWATLEPLQNVIITVNSTPEQQLISKDGSYSFELAAGDYEIVAKYYENNSLVLGTEERIAISSEGSYALDLIMFPSIDLGDPLFDDGPNLDEDYLYVSKDWLIYFLVIALMATGAIILFYFKMSRTPVIIKKPDRLDKDSKQVLDIIRREKRITQRDIRKKFAWSEAKISLIVSDLEERGLVKKIKKGRGNILRII
jgi:uncharacterized membrane protein